MGTRIDATDDSELALVLGVLLSCYSIGANHLADDPANDFENGLDVVLLI